MTGAARGPIAWMARNPVAANLLMAFFLVGGFIFAFRVKQEVFPEIELDTITIVVPYPGASPAEVEQGIVLPIEEGVRGLDGVKRVTATAGEGLGTVVVELLLTANRNKLLQDVKNAVDRIVSFPLDAERPIVSLLTSRREVISLVLYGDAPEMSLRLLAEGAREELLQDRRITQVELPGVRPLEIGIEVPQARLRAHNLTLEEIARQIGRTALELPGGGVKTPGGEVLLRTAERRDLGAEFADIPVASRADGMELLLEEIAAIHDGFAETDQATFFNGKPAVRIVVYRVGEQTPLEVAQAVKETVERIRPTLPPGLEVTEWSDWSDLYRQRIHLLLGNARLGLILVLVLLGLALEIRLAFWVTLGIPISFLGSLILLPATDVSINMISLFAFILTLGIVVDDAIIVGENVYEIRSRGGSFLEAAIEGARKMAVPVTFSILTNIAAFLPLFFVPGTMGKFFGVVPVIVVAVFTISWLESLFILPAHLGHQRPRTRRGLGKAIGRLQDGFAALLAWQIRSLYTPAASFCLKHPLFTIALAAAALILTGGFILGDRIDFTFMPQVESDIVIATAALPYGSPVAQTLAVQERMVSAAQETLERNGGPAMAKGILATVGSAISTRPMAEAALGGGHLASVMLYLVPSDERPFSSLAFESEWRRAIGEIPGLESLEFLSTAGPGSAAAIDVELGHPDLTVLEQTAARLAEELKGFAGLKDINKGFSPGKPQLDFKLRPEAASLGLTPTELGRQVRSAFYGAEALRQQRGRNEVRVFVRLPESERKSEYNVEELLIRTRDGGEMPLGQAAEVVRGRAYTVIRRAEGRRVLNVTANVEEGVTTSGKVIRELKAGVLPRLAAEYPLLRYGFEGQQRDMRESMQSLGSGFLLAILAIYTLLAIPFRSYFQPLIIMTAIPFGIVGAVVGHLIMGFDLSLISLMGIVALAGVVVNDSLVLVHAANTFRDEEGMTPFEAALAAGQRRFRPIVLTSVTTFFGLAPMIFETSVQARFLIPMAVSLGFGILAATFIATLLVPALLMLGTYPLIAHNAERYVQ